MDLRTDLDMECKEKFLLVLGNELTELYLLDIFRTEEINTENRQYLCLILLFCVIIH